ncbi:MAG: DUF402 domain-containing protein [Pseudomonadales bacterium]|nr:DUF402 domain-containing protein [Pseudomonadales bacterium]
MAFKSSKWVEEYKDVLVGSPKTFHCELLDLADTEAVVVYQLAKEVILEGTHMPPGTISFGYFWQERNFNVYHFVAKTGNSLGFYFNVSDSTQIGETRIYWRDLVVDIFITPDGRCRVLDEDEIPENLDPSLRKSIEQTRDHILSNFRQLTEEVAARSRLLTLQMDE